MAELVPSPMKSVHWSHAVQDQAAIYLWRDEDGELSTEVIASALSDPPSIILVTDRGRHVSVDEQGMVSVIDPVEPLKVLARLPDDSYVTLVQWVRRRDDLRHIQALDAGGGRMTMNMIAAQDWHPLRVRFEAGHEIPVEVVRGV